MLDQINLSDISKSDLPYLVIDWMIFLITTMWKTRSQKLDESKIDNTDCDTQITGQYSSLKASIIDLAEFVFKLNEVQINK